MNVHDVQQVRSFEHPGAGRKRAKSTPKGRQVDPHRRPRDRASARRPAAAARSPDRASAPDPGQISPDFGRPSRSPCRRDEAVVCGGVRDRDLLRAFRRGEGRRARYRAADHSRLRLAHLRHAGRGKTAARIAGQGRPRHSRGARALRRPSATPRRPPKSATTLSIIATVAEVLDTAARGETHRASCRDYVDYDAYVAGGGYKLLERLRSGELSARKTS